MNSDTWFERLPKIELHLHLEGAIPYDALWSLVQKYAGEVSSREELILRFQYTDFAHFLDTWFWKNQFLREYEDFTFLSEAVARDLAAQNIRYAEVFFSPVEYERHGLQTQRLVEAIRAGLERVNEVEVALVADLVRDFGPQSGARTLAEVNEVKHKGVVGVGIGGAELEYPPEAYEQVYAQARGLGFHTSAHAGEAAGPPSIWGAIRRLEAERIGHGVRMEEDEALLEYVVAQQIPIELCPLSNVRTGVVSSYAAHPVRRYFERGVLLCINTDDPKMFGNSLAEELRLLVERKGFTPPQIRQLLLNGIRMAWLPEEQKAGLAERFTSDPVWNAEPGDMFVENGSETE